MNTMARLCALLNRGNGKKLLVGRKKFRCFAQARYGTTRF